MADDAQLERFTDVVFVANDDPIEAALEVVLTLRALVWRTRRLAATGPPQLRWRHDRTAAGLEKLLDATWPAL